MSKWNKGIILSGLLLIALILTNPSEDFYLNHIGTEYGAMHHGAKFEPEVLLHMGNGNRNNFIFLSQYRYSFGNISVSYLGFGGFIFKTGVIVGEVPVIKKEKGNQIIT